MKIIESDSNKLVVQIQQFKPASWDLNNNFNGLEGLLAVLFMLGFIWYQSNSQADFFFTLIIGSTVAFVYISALLLYSFAQQRYNFYEVDLYFFDRDKNTISLEMVSSWGARETHYLCPLNEISSINLEVLFEPKLEDLRPDQQLPHFKTTYKVKMGFVSGGEKTLEYNSISTLSNSRLQNDFRDLIAQTTDVIEQIRKFSEASPRSA